MTPAKILLKEGVTGDMAAPTAWAADQAAVVYGWFGLSEMTITAIENGQHKPGSLHSRGYAIDIRTRDIVQSMVPALVGAIKGIVGAAFDVVLEASDTPGASAPHVHLEFDPEHNGGLRLPVVS